MLLRRLIYTGSDPAVAAVRLVLGIIFFAHGAQKMLGWFGGPGFDPTMSAFTQHMGIPAPFAFLAISAEFFGGIGLILGFLARVAAFGIAVNMVVAIVKVHAHNGLFMNWQGTQRGEGFEFHLLVLAMAFLLMAHGAGAWSIDGALSPSRTPHAVR